MIAADVNTNDTPCDDLLDWLEHWLGFRIRVESCPMEWEE